MNRRIEGATVDFGIDVHEHALAAALIDEQGRQIAAPQLPSRPSGYRRLIDLADRSRRQRGSDRRRESWQLRTLPGRRFGGRGVRGASGPSLAHPPRASPPRTGKTDPGDALSIAQVVLTSREDLGPAEEPEIVRALAMLELQRRRFVRDRTQAIQRLRSDWTQHDPVAEAGTIRCDRHRELAKLNLRRTARFTLGRLALGGQRSIGFKARHLGSRLRGRGATEPATQHPCPTWSIADKRHCPPSDPDKRPYEPSGPSPSSGDDL
jgi:hypothetical protein